MRSEYPHQTCPVRLLAFLLCLLAAGCGTGSTQQASTPSASSVPSATPSQPTSSPGTPSTASATARPSAKPAGTTIITADSDFGTILHDASGQPIYLFDAETSSRPKCYDDCAKAWPPVLTAGAPRSKGKVQSGLLGTTRRSDGSIQITYAGHPLYFYAHEGKYQVLCHNVTEFGGTWLVVQPTGKPAA